ncbi:MAG: hypothetical protein SFY70_04970 [Bacteroidia bacterium]|nr:hypothetical protein [Bacteroidia bacterium]
MTSSLSTPTPPRTAALLLLAAAVSFTAIFAWLAAAFGYPDVLERPAAEVLPRLAFGGTRLQAIWTLYALLPLVLLPIAAQLAQTLESPFRRNLFRMTGALAAFTLSLGLIRWPSLHTYLAQVWLAADTSGQANIELLFAGANQLLGTYLGEFVAELFLYSWIGLGAATLKHSRLRGLRYLAYATALNGVVGAFRWMGGVPEWAGELSNVLLPGWLLLWGVALLLPKGQPTPGTVTPLAKTPVRWRGIVVCAALAAGAITQVHAQSRFEGHDLSINGFRNPSIGLEYRRGQVSGHVGYYSTILPTGVGDTDETNGYLRTGATVWFLPFGKLVPTPSSAYASASWLVSTHETPSFAPGLLLETGLRFFVWRGLNARIGVAALMRPGKTYINPTPGISWTIPLH